MKKLNMFIILLISFQLQAGVTSQMLTDYQNAMDGKIAPHAGNTYVWGGGVLTRNQDGTLTYVNTKDPSITHVVKTQDDLKILATISDDVKKGWIAEYGVNALATSADYSKNSQDLTKLLSKTGTPNSSSLISGTGAAVFYDENGQAKSIIMPDGSVKKISEYLNTKEYSASVGIVDSTGSKDFIAQGVSNPIPENFNGEVKITTEKNADGSLKILDGLASASGGEFSRAYNGISGTVLDKDPLSESEYNLKFLDLTAQVWGVTEIGQKMCKPTGKDFPKSLTNWWTVLKNYVEAEKKRNALLQTRTASLKSMMDSATQSTSNIQLDGIKVQIESLNIGIDSLSGSSLYSGDKLASEVRATSRLAWREAVLAAIYQGIEDGQKETSKVVDAYAKCSNSVQASMEIAGTACNKSIVDCDRTKEVTGADGIKTIIPDPVPGSCELKSKSCEMANVNLPLFQKVSLKDLVELYGVKPIPTKELNERMLRLLSMMKKQITILFPRSNDSKYDWTTPLLTCIEPLAEPIKYSGVICPADANDKDYDKSTFAHLGKSDDLISELNHYTVGQKWNADSATYAVNNDTYTSEFNNTMTKLAAQNNNMTDKSKVLSEDEMKANAEENGQRAVWSYWINGPYSKNFNAGRPTSYGIDRNDELAAAKKVMDEKHLLDINCSTSTCQSAAPVVASSNIVVPDPKTISDNAKLFLTAMGVTNGSSNETAKLLADKWNVIDLYFGQSKIRELYFNYNADLINKLILSDRAKLGKLLTDRQKLIDFYNKLKKSLEGTSSGSNNSIAAVNHGTSSGTNSPTNYSGAVVGPTANTTSAIDSNRGSTASLAGLNNVSTMSIASGGLLSLGNTPKESSLGTSNIGGSSSNGQVYSIANNKRISKLKESIKKLQPKLDSMAISNRNGASTTAQDEKKMNALFSSKPSALSQGGAALLSSISGAKGITSEETAAHGLAPETTTGSKSSNYSGNSGSGGYYGNGGSGSSMSGSSSSTTYSKGSNGMQMGGNSNSPFNSPSNSGSGNAFIPGSASAGKDSISPEDQRKFQDAVFARDNNERKDKFDRQKNDSLFKIIEKAHIRSYQKIQR